MAKLAFLTRILAGASVGMCSLAFAWTASAQVPAGTPDFSSANRAWLRVGIPFLDPVSGKILGEDPEHPFSTRGVDAQGRDVSGTPSSPDWKNKNLKPWAAQKLKEYADEAQKGKIRITASASCWPGGTPGQMIFNEPLFLLQSPDKITLLYQRDHFVRHIYMNVPHTKNPKPSWFGESVGHYEGDELVVDTTGFNDKGELDNWGTPHTEALHVTERYRMSADGKTLRVNFTVEDPKTFNQPWTGVAVYRQTTGPMIEAVCSENNFDFFIGESYPVPEAKTADF